LTERTGVDLPAGSESEVHSGSANHSGSHAHISSLLISTLVALFFLSGASGLIYQVLWLRLLSLVFGITVYAASTVLASFMTGLALGSFLAGKFVDRIRHPLLWYGVAEVLVGLSALMTPAALDVVEHLYISLQPRIPDAFPLVTALRFVLSFAVLLVPTALMGATLPIIIKSSLIRSERLGERVGLLYATNTGGAILGTLLAGFYLIPTIGMSASFKLAAAINGLVGIAAVAASSVLSRRQRGSSASLTESEATSAEGATSEDPLPDRIRKLVLIVFALSGFASLAVEIVWFRLLALFLEVSTYAFTIMLATFLLGITAGSYLITPLMKRRADWLRALALIEMAIGIITLVSFIVLKHVYGWFLGSDAQSPIPFIASIEGMIAIALIVVFPATLLMGVAFPIGLRLWAAGGDGGAARIGERIGIFYSLNVLGAIAGSIVAGFLLLPWLGGRVSLIVLSVVSLLSGLLLLKAAEGWKDRSFVRVGGIGVIVFAVVAVLMPNPFAIVQMQHKAGEQLLWREEDVQKTVSVFREPTGTLAMYLDSVPQTSDKPVGVRIHQRIGNLGLALHPNPKEILVIGLGGGATPGAIGVHDGVQVDVVELSEAVAHGAEWFRHVNYDVLNQPNTNLRIDDGRNHLLLTKKRYDIITADVIFPFHAGSSNLNSVEYFKLAYKALKDDGVMVQYVYRRNESQYKLIARTFQSVFPHVSVWAKGGLLVGTKQPLLVDRAVFDQKLENPVTKRVFKSTSLGSFEDLLRLYQTDGETLGRFVGAGPLITDDWPFVEFFLSFGRDDRKVKVRKLRGDPMQIVKR
jgi:spermidine synthase